MIKVKNKEKAIRAVEVFHVLSVVLPIYDDEARSLFRATFKVDMADLIPKFFKSLALISIKNDDEFNEYLAYFRDLIRYLDLEIDEIPKPANTKDQYFIHIRAEAEKLLNAWMVKDAVE